MHKEKELQEIAIKAIEKLSDFGLNEDEIYRALYGVASHEIHDEWMLERILDSVGLKKEKNSGEYIPPICDIGLEIPQDGDTAESIRERYRKK